MTVSLNPTLVQSFGTEAHAAQHTLLGGDLLHRPVGSAVLKRFSDLRNVSFSGAGTVTATIDQNSPFGGPAMKLVCTGTGQVDIDLTNVSVQAFDDHVAASWYIDDATGVASFSTLYGTTGFAHYQQYNNVVFSGGDLVAGPRVIFGGPLYTAAINTFVHGTDTLQAVRLRLTLMKVGTTVWLKDVFIPARQRPVVAFTWDDGEHPWASVVSPLLLAAGIKGTFSVNTASITGSFTSADITALKAAGHQVACHNVNNYKLQTLYNNGTGEDNGTGTSVDAAGYATEYYTARNTLLAIAGTDPGDMCYHPWVQGGADVAGVELLRANGVDIGRAASGGGGQPYGFLAGNNAMYLRAVPIDSTATGTSMSAAIDATVKYGGLLVFMGHTTVDSGATGPQANVSDLTTAITYAGGLVGAGTIDVLTMRQLRDRLIEMGALVAPSTNPSPPIRCIGRKLAADFNVTTDQAITLLPGNWTITGVYAAKGTRSMTTAAGGVYTAAAKGGTAIVAAAQTYTGLTGATTDVVTCTMAATPTVNGSGVTGATIYFALTTGQGSAGTADIFVFGRPA